MSISPDEFRRVMGSFAAGVTVVTATGPDGRRWGITVTAFSSLSLDPPLCLVCIDARAGSHDVIVETGRFAVNMLRDGQQELSNHFATTLEDKYAGVDHRIGEASGCPLLVGALATIECELASVLPGGDHSIFIGRILATEVEEGEPLVYWRGGYRKIVGA